VDVLVDVMVVGAMLVVGRCVVMVTVVMFPSRSAVPPRPTVVNLVEVLIRS
jgi:hypothetical protein